MKKNILVLLLLMFFTFNGVSADQISCEKIESHGWISSLDNWRTCNMRETTQINSADTTIASRDESVQGLWLSYNKKVFSLPVGLSEKFPNLLALDAGHCSLTTISKANFKGLSKMRYLRLGSNQIEKIPNNVFEDLVALEYLFLDGNKLKFINGKAFARFTKLNRIDLSSNQCIDENFSGASRIAVLQQTVNEKCSFDEFDLDDYVKKTFSLVSSFADKKCEKPQDLTTFTTTLEGMKTETSGARSEVINMLNELKTQQKEECGNIAKALEAQTKAFEAQAKFHAIALKDQQTYFNGAIQVQAKTLKEQTAEIIDCKVQSELQTMLKMAEIEKLSEELQRKNAEIIENNGKIKKLEEKIETLS